MLDTEHEEWLKDREAQSEQVRKRAAEQASSAQVHKIAADDKAKGKARKKTRRTNNEADDKEKANRSYYN